MKKYILEIIVFISGAVVMILELVGSRVLAPYVGTSIIVWTSLIGIILGSLSLGYWLGGRVADKWPRYRVLGTILLIAGFLIGLISFSKEFVLSIIQAKLPDIRWGSIVATLILFAPSSVLLGMVSPFAVRLKMRSLKTSGETAGNLYALSTIGSIVGTFAAGFFLIAYFGHTKTLALLSALLFLASFLAILRADLTIKSKFFALFFFILMVASLTQTSSKPIAFVDIDTIYGRVLLEKREKDGRPLLSMRTGARIFQSAMFLDGDDDLAFSSLRHFRLVEHFSPKLQKALMIGGAGYAFPKDFLKRNADASIDVVEIDPGITKLARKYFNLKDNPRLTIYHADGREFLAKTKSEYDAIFLDAYEGDSSIPFQLTTLEAVKEIYSALEEDGVAFLNIISSIEGETGKFLRAELATYESVFPQVYLFPVGDHEESYLVQNILLVALKSEKKPSLSSNDDELADYLGHLWAKRVSRDMPVLTDDLAPVEQYTMSINLK